MIKKMTRHGNSLALVMDRGVLDILNIEEDTPLSITTDGTVLIVSPVKNQKRQKLFEAALVKANAKYGRMLKRLSE